MSTKNNHVKIKTWLMEGKRHTKLIRIQNPGGHKEGRASFPIQSQYKVSKIHASNSIPREERRRTERGREGDGRKGQAAPGWERERSVPGAKREREGVRGYLWCPRRGPKYP